MPICPLCGRPIPAPQRDAHHLVPKSRGGRETEFLHRICHRQIHALLTESELARDYNTVEALMAHPEMARFVAWVRGKPPGFAARSRKSQRVRGR
ncbi:MAG: HNH endonuclease [Rhodoferax sp.]|nr:HNH endonuclease [Rhodoferax sp.]MCB2027634.1 HNH endonuclease [Rhodoferax sp.]MCB2044361.1 HNH endonuclease [Rhodoferax sp.]MCW5643951.1 HNH endonuclease [Rhodoferax sp.]